MEDSVSRTGRWLVLAGLGLGLVFAALLYAPVISVYHLEQAGKNLTSCETENAACQQAVQSLRQLLGKQPTNAQAYQLLSKVYRIQEDWAAAADAQMRFVDLRPNNPVGYKELAELYEEIEEQIESAHRVYLLDLLSRADVHTPEAPVDTPYGRSVAPSWQSYVAQTTFSLPPNYGDRPTLFMHSPSLLTYTLQLPSQPTILRFDMGMDPLARDWPGDGVTFEVFVDGERVFLEHVDKDMASQGWHRRTVDLSQWTGQEVPLALAVSPGPVADATGDWAGWAEPQVVDAQVPRLEALNPAVARAEAWQQAGLTSESFLRWGEVALSEGLYDEALTWYNRAIRDSPDLRDVRYYRGLVYEGQERWIEALQDYEAAATSQGLSGDYSSSLDFHRGLIYQLYLDPPQLDRALAAYEAALAENEFVSTREAADCYFRRGEVLRRQGAKPTEYISDFRQAIALNPRHGSAHFLLGVATFELDGDFAAAESELRVALDLAPQNKWVPYYLGNLYWQQGHMAEAVKWYQQALALDPEFSAAQEKLDGLREADG